MMSGAALMEHRSRHLQIGFCHDGFPFLPVWGLSVMNRCRSQTTAGYMRVLGHAQLFVAPQTVAPPGSSPPWNSPGMNTGGVAHFLLRELFPIQGSNCAPLVSPVVAGVKILQVQIAAVLDTPFLQSCLSFPEG